AVGELGLDLEQSVEVGVGAAEEVEQVQAADDDHLDVERDRLRLQGGGAEWDVEVERVDLHAATLEGALQLLPDLRLLDGVVEVEDGDAAVGPQETTALDLREVGEDLAGHADGALDEAEQVLVGRHLLHDHRRPLAVAVVDDDVDLV